MNLTSPHSFLQAMSLYSGRGNTNKVAEWYGELAEVMKAHICVVGFEPIICLLSERSASAMLVQCLAERWWGTIHTFHIAEKEMTVTPYDFHCMTGLRCDNAIIDFKGELSTRLAINLLRRRYYIDMIRYFDIKTDY